MAFFDYRSDGPWRRVRAARGNGAETLSATNNVDIINWITTKPTITSLSTLESNSTGTLIASGNPLRRDRAIDVNGTALNTAIAIEIVQKDGTSFQNPVVINLPNAGVTVDDNGSRIQVSANVIPYNDADGHTTDQQRKFKVYNVIGNHTFTDAFNVNVQPTVSGIGTFGGDGVFNRHQISGDDVTIYGTGFYAITEIELVDENGTALTNNPKIVLPHPGVTVTDTVITIDTQTAQFNNALNADSLSMDRFRRLQLSSARDPLKSAVASRFLVGVPPTYTSHTGIYNTNTDYRRDSDTIAVTGIGLGLISTVQIVDINGNPIPGVTDATDTTGISSVTTTTFSLDANASAFTAQGHLLDSATYLSNNNGTRRLRVVTPFGFAVSPATGAFTISATANYLPTGLNTADNTFAGSADFNGSEYNATRGLLVINGVNFRGIKRLNLVNGDSYGEDDGNMSSIAIDPNSPPAGITINAAGTQISMTKQAVVDINGTWLGVTARRIMVWSAADQNSTTPLIVPNQ